MFVAVWFVGVGFDARQRAAHRLRENDYDNETRRAVSQAQNTKLWSKATFDASNGLPAVNFRSLIESDDSAPKDAAGACRLTPVV